MIKKSKEIELKSLESRLWEAADKLRGNLEAAEYKHVVLGLIFLKYISDSYESRREDLVKKSRTTKQTSPSQTALFDKPESYWSDGAFWVPEEAQWQFLKIRIEDPKIAYLIDEAMNLIEENNPQIKDALPKNYTRADVDSRVLGELVEVIDTIGFTGVDHGADDVLGRVYEYFLGKFAAAEGRGAGEFYTPRSIVNLLVNMLEPYKGKVYDPCCGTGGMFVQSSAFVEAHGGEKTDISVYGQEFVAATWRLAKMNMQLRALNADLGVQAADTFFKDQHPDLKADFIIANPPFNMSDWGQPRLLADKRWKYGLPPKTNANFAWVQHMLSHLSETGTAGFVLANGSLTSNQSGEGAIRKNLVEADLVECIVHLPSHLFYSTQISVCLWFMSNAKTNDKTRKGKTLFIDARDMGVLIDKTHRALRDEELSMITSAYQNWRNGEKYKDIKGFSKVVTTEEIAEHKYALVPGRYVGFKNPPDIKNLDIGKMKEDIADIENLLSEVDNLSRSALKVLGRISNG